MTVYKTVAKGQIEVFISYSTLDKKFATELKEKMNLFGLKAFLAHQDLNPSVEWQDTILSSLRSCDVFVPILTNNFKKSFWTDQESGIALSLGKHILPLRIHVNPQGFLSRFQALKGKKGQPIISAEHILQALAGQPKLRPRVIRYLIKAFGESDNFVNSIAISKALLLLSPFVTAQLRLIFEHAISNEQIHNSNGAGNYLRQLLKANKKRISKEQLKKYKLYA